MKLSKNDMRDARDIHRQPASPAKLTRLLQLLEASVNKLPLDANAPAPVTEAHQSFIGAAARAKQKIEQVETAEQAAKQAPAHDADAAAEAMRAGKPTPKPSEAKAAEAVKSALVDTEGAAQLLETAHDALIEAVRDQWATWRAQIVRDAAAARLNAVEATAAAAVAVATGRALFAAVGQLDNGVLSRDEKLLEAVSAETRQGIGWYGSAHIGGAPLQNVLIPGVKYRGDPMALDLAVVVETVAAAVAQAENVPASDWVPPTDPRHADLLAQPLDPDQPWVRWAIMRKYGDVCVVCKRPGTEEAVEVNDAIGPWGMVHTRCKNQAPDAKAQKHAERQAKMQREGFPPSPNEASQIVGPSGRVHKDKDFNG